MRKGLRQSKYLGTWSDWQGRHAQTMRAKGTTATMRQNAEESVCVMLTAGLMCG